MRIEDLPKVWQDEIAKGSDFGKRARRVLNGVSLNQQTTHPDASTLGTQLLTAFKSALGKDIPCGTCRQLLLSWNQSESIDVADATEKIYRISLEIPETTCERNPASQRQWIRGVIESVKGKHNDRIN
jgi:hypothetical protein